MGDGLEGYVEDLARTVIGLTAELPQREKKAGGRGGVRLSSFALASVTIARGWGRAEIAWMHEAVKAVDEKAIACRSSLNRMKEKKLMPEVKPGPKSAQQSCQVVLCTMNVTELPHD